MPLRPTRSGLRIIRACLLWIVVGLVTLAGWQATAMAAADPAARYGILVLAHGGTNRWDTMVRKAVRAVDVKAPIDVAFTRICCGIRPDFIWPTRESTLEAFKPIWATRTFRILCAIPKWPQDGLGAFLRTRIFLDSALTGIRTPASDKSSWVPCREEA